MKQFTLSCEITVPDSVAAKVTANPKAYSSAVFRVLSGRLKEQGFSVSEAILKQGEDADPDNSYFIMTAKTMYTREGEIEVDTDAIVSPSQEGAYVQAWVWVARP